jgi:hypothetical protein
VGNLPFPEEEVRRRPLMMIIDMNRLLRETQNLDEMAIRVISWPEDGLPFDICIMDPETIHRNDPHAHLFEPKKGGKDLGMRLLLYSMEPRSVMDIRDAFPNQRKYKPIPHEWRDLIFLWAKRRSKVLPKISNWEDLWVQWIHSISKR